MKQWEKPKLIVLVRSRPEENILQTCKWTEYPPQIGGPGNYATVCDYHDYGTTGCESGLCSTLGAS